MTEFQKHQFELSKIRALYWQTMALTGCPGRQLEIWVDSENRRRLATREELVEDALKIMNRHIELMDEILSSVEAK